MSYLKGIAQRYITGARNNVRVMYNNASTDDIITVIHHADGQCKEYTERYVKYLQDKHNNNTRAILQEVWELLKSLRYKPDDGHQKIKSPAQLMADGVGDCKSYSIFTASVLKNLGIKYVYRYADYDNDNDVNHVYVIAHPAPGKTIVIDAVHTSFDKEAPGANYIFDIDPTNPDVRKPGARIAGTKENKVHYVAIAAAATIILLLIVKK